MSAALTPSSPAKVPFSISTAAIAATMEARVARWTTRAMRSSCSAFLASSVSSTWSRSG